MCARALNRLVVGRSAPVLWGTPNRSSRHGAWTTMRIVLTHLLRWQDRANFPLFGQYISGPFVDHADGTGDRGGI
jgi:hypothetical protein